MIAFGASSESIFRLKYFSMQWCTRLFYYGICTCPVFLYEPASVIVSVNICKGKKVQKQRINDTKLTLLNTRKCKCLPLEVLLDIIVMIHTHDK